MVLVRCRWRVFAGVLVVLAAANRLMAETAGGETAGAEMATAAREFLDSLTPEQKAKAALAFDDPARRDWHWIPKPERKGLKLGLMTPEQREKAHALLRTGLSDAGYQKATTIFGLEAVLKVLEKDMRGVRDPQKYYFTIFGTPGPTGRWGWSCEGHHFSLNYTIENGAIVASTPTFFGANPRWMPVALDVGPKQGTRTLDDEEKLALALLESLSPEQKKEAWREKVPNKFLVLGPPTSLHAAGPEGLAAARMTTAQIAILKKLLALHAGNIVPAEGERRLAALEAAGIENIHFLWCGAPGLVGNHFFRLQGPTFILELDNTQEDPVGTTSNHIHSVWRSPGGDFGTGE